MRDAVLGLLILSTLNQSALSKAMDSLRRGKG